MYAMDTESVPCSKLSPFEPRLNTGLGFGRGAAAAAFDVGGAKLVSAAGFAFRDDFDVPALGFASAAGLGVAAAAGFELAVARALRDGFSATFSTLITGSFCFPLPVRVVLCFVFVATGAMWPLALSHW